MMHHHSHVRHHILVIDRAISRGRPGLGGVVAVDRSGYLLGLGLGFNGLGLGVRVTFRFKG